MNGESQEIKYFDLPPGGMAELHRYFAEEGYVTIGSTISSEGFWTIMDADGIRNLGQRGFNALIRWMEEEADPGHPGLQPGFRVEPVEEGYRLLADPDRFHDLPGRVRRIMEMTTGAPAVIDGRRADLAHMARFLSNAMEFERPDLDVLERDTVYEDLLELGYPGLLEYDRVTQEWRGEDPGSPDPFS